MTEFASDLITLNDIVNKRYFFNIPIYQRLYVWGKEQIHTLLDDIVSACQEQKNTFYLGGSLVVERSPVVSNGLDYPVFDLIDGQQRFTTLWLISIVLGDLLTDYRQVKTDSGIRPRISFAIRPEVTAFFEKTCRGESASLPEARQLEDALQEIRSYFNNYSNNSNDKPLDTAALAQFIFYKVQLILTRVPEHTDLNKLFEVINNRGVQLQHHEILKAKLLEKISRDEREPYSLLWDACSNMNDYVERNLNRTTQVDGVALYESKIQSPLSGFKREALASPTEIISALRNKNGTEDCAPTSLLSVLTTTTDFSRTDGVSENEEPDLPDRVNSIITFSMLLQHVLRIYLHRSPAFPDTDITKVSDKDLLAIFDAHWLKFKPAGNDVKAFIELLWQVRYLFDKHVIKWVSVEEERVHAIRRLYVNRSRSRGTAYLQRLSSDAEPEFALLQSMLYHSQQMSTQYWLTPLLNFLLDNNEENAYLYLQHLDNNLFCSEANASLIERTHRYLVNPWHKETLLDASVSLDQKFDNGTQYPHYWFYKLEFILYIKKKSINPADVEGFRITAKNSVEHVTPQNPEKESDRIPDELLHSFGNLALVTRSLNSEMSNKGFSIKKAEFNERLRGHGVSLKLEDIYDNTQWQKNEIELHQKKMIHEFNQYLSTVKAQVQELIGE